MQIVVVADIVMSLDNVIAVAAAANGSIPLLILGLASSVPLIVAGAALIMALLNYLPVLIWAGAALLGWIAGDVIATDPAACPRLQNLFDGSLGIALELIAGMVGGGSPLCRRRKGGRTGLLPVRRHRRPDRGIGVAERKLACAEHRAPAAATEAVRPLD